MKNIMVRRIGLFLAMTFILQWHVFSQTNDQPSLVAGNTAFALDLYAQLFAFFAGELFRVIQAFVPVFFREDHGCGNNGAGEASASGFIASGFDQVFGKG